MTELLPCPFCGAPTEIVTDKYGTWGILEHKADCLWYFSNFPKHVIPERDFEKWNIRDACFHCQYGAKPMTEENMRAEGWVRERTCRNISDPPEGFLCSACGWGDFAEPSHLLSNVNYCPHCGAKVLRNVTASQTTPFSDVADSESARFSSFEYDSCWSKSGYYNSKDEAIKAWNTSYVETCYSERTDCFECGECGFLDAYAAPDAFRYCPNCGRKVEQ